MMKLLQRFWIFMVVCATLVGCSAQQKERTQQIAAARGVIERTLGAEPQNLTLKLTAPTAEGLDTYNISATGGHLTIEGSSPTALCYAFNHYLHRACHSQVVWGGKHLCVPTEWPDYSESGTSPYELRYFLNVCTFGYTAPYWDWERWEQELDWMALHGVNFPLASVASEAIARRVWVRLGLTPEEADAFFTGAAHLPWHRMGNLNSFDGPLTEEWHEGQIELQHKILARMRELGMNPVAPAFAGFVPPTFIEKNPDITYNQLLWGGFDKSFNAVVLAPNSPWFSKIGQLFVEEWEAEFGDATYYLSDSFNEMRLPVEPGDTEGKHALLADYGEAIYNSIIAGDPDAVWVTQGWTFGYQHDFWDKESMQALLSRVPDDRMIIIDLGCDYPKWVWKTEQTWKVQEGFYGKKWIFSYVPNFGGKVLPTGELQMYATSSAEALASPAKGNLVGFGSAPEGLENNEVVYELLADMGWTSEAIDLDEWVENYCTARYGAYNENIKAAWDAFRGSVYSSLYSYPRFTWQTVVPDQRRKSAHDINDLFGEGVVHLLAAAEECGGSPLYVNDVVEMSAMWLSEVADRHYEKALSLKARGHKRAAKAELTQTIEILRGVDALLAHHPNHRLENWVTLARKSAESVEAQNAAEANAKRLIATWGGWQEDYAARLWSDMVARYYIPRLEIYFAHGAAATDKWEEEWIGTPMTEFATAEGNPVELAKSLVEHYK